jgi:hypothetical protein
LTDLDQAEDQVAVMCGTIFSRIYSAFAGAAQKRKKYYFYLNAQAVQSPISTDLDQAADQVAMMCRTIFSRIYSTFSGAAQKRKKYYFYLNA